jgi:hypothetical protein
VFDKNPEEANVKKPGALPTFSNVNEGGGGNKNFKSGILWPSQPLQAWQLKKYIYLVTVPRSLKPQAYTGASQLQQ